MYFCHKFYMAFKEIQTIFNVLKFQFRNYFLFKGGKKSAIYKIFSNFPKKKMRAKQFEYRKKMISLAPKILTRIHFMNNNFF